MDAWGKAVTTAVYERACVRTRAVRVCAHNIHSREKKPCTHHQSYACLSERVCPTQCVADTWHFPWSVHFNDFIDVNVFLSADHISQ